MARLWTGIKPQAAAVQSEPRESTGQSGPMPAGSPRRRATDSDAFAKRVVHLFANNAWKPRLKAAAIHLGLSLVAAATVVGWVLGVWYPQELAHISGVHMMLALLAGVDVVLGPVCTFLVFDRRKRSLATDLAIIGALQVAALAYGVHVIERGRPQFVVLVKDRFEVVAPAELTANAKLLARNNPIIRSRSMSPQWLATKDPGPGSVSPASVLQSLSGGRGRQHHPDLYEPLNLQLAAAAARGIPVEQIRRLNPESRAMIDQAILNSGESEANLRVLPLRGPARDASVLVSLKSEQVLEILLVEPW